MDKLNLELNLYSAIKSKLPFFVATTIYFLNLGHFPAQTYYKCKIQLLYSSKQFTKQSENYLDIRKVEMKKGLMEITLKNNKKLRVSPDSVWGYQIKDNGYIKRIYKGFFYNLIQIDSVILYSRRDYSDEFWEYRYYFSFNLDSEIYSVNKSNIRKVFSNNECIQKKLKSLKLTQYPADWDLKKQTVRFMTWFKECKL